jgi:hypothetical protein
LIELALNLGVAFDRLGGGDRRRQFVLALLEHAVVALAEGKQLRDGLFDVVFLQPVRALGEWLCRRFEPILDRHQHRRLPGDRRLADQAGDEMRLRRDLQDVSQFVDLLGQRALDDLVGGFSGIFRAGDHVEIGVIDNRVELFADFSVNLVHGIELVLDACVHAPALGDRRLERLEIAVQSLRRGFHGGEGGTVAAGPQPLHRRLQGRVALPDQIGDALLIGVARGGNQACRRGRDLARNRREPQRIGHERHFVTCDALDTLLGRRK